jgi:hypothetical protein
MHKGCEQHRYDPNERESRKESVTRSENFRRVARQRIDRTHSGEDHRGIQERIDPAQVREEMIAENTDSESTDQDSKRHQTVSPNAPEEFSAA